MNKPIVWTGDLADDCCARWGGMTAHCEVMYDAQVRAEGEKRASTESFWFAAVYRGKRTIFSTADVGGLFVGGHLARATCETIMRLAAEASRLGVRVPELEKKRSHK